MKEIKLYQETILMAFKGEMKKIMKKEQIEALLSVLGLSTLSYWRPQKHKGKLENSRIN